MKYESINLKEHISKFYAGLKCLIGLECWSIIAGKGTGSIISLNIGNRIPLDKISSNNKIPDIARRYTGEYGIFIECAWRLDNINEVICGSQSSNEDNGPMLTGLQQLVPSHISDIQLYEPAKDLKIIFDNEYQLNIFCDNTNPEDYEDNYSLFTPDITFLVMSLGRIKLE